MIDCKADNQFEKKLNPRPQYQQIHVKSKFRQINKKLNTSGQTKKKEKKQNKNILSRAKELF